MIDCVVVGFNEWSYQDYVTMMQWQGVTAPAYRDLNLNFIEHEGRFYRSLDFLNRYRAGAGRGQRRLHNADFLWPVVAYLVSFLTRRGFNAEYVNLFQQEKDKLRDLLLTGEVRTVAITTTLYFNPFPIREIISFVRRYDDNVKIVVGGPHIANLVKYSDPQALAQSLQAIGADYYVNSSEGEQTLAALLACLKRHGQPSTVPNLAYPEGAGFARTSTEVEANPLVENRVDYGLFPPHQIGDMVSLRTAKSCPFSCAFCGFPEMAGDYTYLSVAHVEEELDALRDIGTVTTLTFLDDTFNVPKTRYKELLRMMIRNRYGFRWNSFYRCDHGDEEAIDLMREAGCEGVFLGMESGSDTMLKKMNKSARREHYRKAIPRLRQAGIVTNASLVIGFPGETADTLEETMELIEEAQPDFFGANLWYCNPGTPVWRQREQLGITGAGLEWRHTTMDAAAACAAVESMFNQVRGAIWLPEDGFELWSVFYLQRRGMSLAEVKGFAVAWNAVVREKLAGGVQSARYQAALAALERCCQSANLADGTLAAAAPPAAMVEERPPA